MDINQSVSRMHLVFRHATEVVGGLGAGLLILTDVDGHRQIAVPCGKESLGQFSTWLDDKRGLRQSLPNVLVKVIANAGIGLRVDIDTVADGTYKALLTNTETLAQLPINTADGIMLSCLSDGDIDITMPSSLFMRQSSPYDKESSGVALPINTLSIDMLQRAIDDAVAKENYELAAQLTNEMKERKKKKEKE